MTEQNNAVATEQQSTPWKELENGILTMVITLFMNVKEQTGSPQIAKKYVREFLEHIVETILSIEKEEESND